MFTIYKVIYEESNGDSNGSQERKITSVALHAFTPLFLPPNRFEEHARIVFPCGFIEHDDSWILTYGEADATCRMVALDKQDVMDHMLYEVDVDIDSKLVQRDLFSRHKCTSEYSRVVPYAVKLFDYHNFYPSFLIVPNPAHVFREVSVVDFVSSSNPIIWDSSLQSTTLFSPPNSPPFPRGVGSSSHFTLASSDSSLLQTRKYVTSSYVCWRDSSNEYLLRGSADHKSNLFFFSSPAHGLVGSELPPLRSSVWSLALQFFYGARHNNEKADVLVPFDSSMVAGKNRLAIDVVGSIRGSEPRDLATKGSSFGYLSFSFPSKTILLPIRANSWNSVIFAYSNDGLSISLNGHAPVWQPLEPNNSTENSKITELWIMKNTRDLFIAIS